MKHILLALAGLLAATAAFAQPAPTSLRAPQPASDTLDRTAPPPPPGGPGGPRADRPMPPPPPRGASVHLAHSGDGSYRLDVDCSERDSTNDCAEIASQMLGKLDTLPKPK